MNNNYAHRALIVGLMSLALAILPGCATKQPGEPLKTHASASDSASSDNKDPFEFINRGLFSIHEVIDGLILKPVAHIYRGVVPQPAQTGIKNALTNMASPVTLLNSALQGDVNNAGRTIGRFVINSTVGIAGIFDVASDMGIKKQHKKDFGQTLGVYGVGTGPYIFIPVLGPSDARDTVGLVADLFSDPFTYILTTPENLVYLGIDGVVKRTDLLPLTDRVSRDSLDPYATYRSMYLQHRESAVRDYLKHDTAGLQKETRN